MKNFSISKIIAATLGAVIVVLAIAFTLQAQTSTLNVKPGSRITYTMQSSSSAQEVNVIVNTLVPTISFKWNSPDNQYGKVIMSNEAFANGKKLASMLFDDPNGDFGFFWLSQNMFNELSQGKTTFTLNNGVKVSGVQNGGIEQIQIKVNGVMKSVSVIHAKPVLPTGGEEFFVLNDPKNPLIIRMKTSEGGFSLTSITE